MISSPPAPGTAAPAAAYSFQQPPQMYQSEAAYHAQSAQYNSHGYNVPHIQNPFVADQFAYAGRGKNSGRFDQDMDPEMETQIAQWQSAYVGKEEAMQQGGSNRGFGGGRREGMQPAALNSNPNGNMVTVSNTSMSASTPALGHPTEPKSKTVMRSGGGQSWTDSTLLEWDPAHFRLFVGNLAGEVTDDSLLKAFSRFSSVQKARVIRDKRTQKSRGYGFVSFSDGDDYFKAAREMQGKYIGSHPVLLRRATTEVRPVSSSKAGKKQHGGGGGGGRAGGGNSAAGGGHGKKVKGDGVKKHEKTKGGLKVLG